MIRTLTLFSAATAVVLTGACSSSGKPQAAAVPTPVRTTAAAPTPVASVAAKPSPRPVAKPGVAPSSPFADVVMVPAPQPSEDAATQVKDVITQIRFADSAALYEAVGSGDGTITAEAVSSAYATFSQRCHRLVSRAAFGAGFPDNLPLPKEDGSDPTITFPSATVATVEWVGAPTVTFRSEGGAWKLDTCPR
jgi:hypothetical protein